jgi:hypothetical protein
MSQGKQGEEEEESGGEEENGGKAPPGEGGEETKEDKIIAARARQVRTRQIEIAIIEDLWSSDSDEMEDSDDEDIVEKIKYRPPVGGAAATAVGGAAAVEATEDELFNELDRIQGRTKAVDSFYSDDDNAAIQRAIVASLENK